MTEAGTGLSVQVVRAFPGRYDSLDLRLAPGATVADALDAARRAGWDLEGDTVAGVAVHGRLVNASAILREGDRLELLRPLVVDPMQRRRARARPGGAR